MQHQSLDEIKEQGPIARQQDFMELLTAAFQDTGSKDLTAIRLVAEELANQLAPDGKPESREIALAVTDLQSASNWLLRAVKS